MHLGCELIAPFTFDEEKQKNSLARQTFLKLPFCLKPPLFVCCAMLSSLFCQSNNDKKCFIAETSALEQLHLGCKLFAPFTFDDERCKIFWRDRHFKKYHLVSSDIVMFVVQCFLRRNTLAYFTIVTMAKMFYSRETCIRQLHLGCKLIVPFTFDNERCTLMWRDRYF